MTPSICPLQNGAKSGRNSGRWSEIAGKRREAEFKVQSSRFKVSSREFLVPTIPVSGSHGPRGNPFLRRSASYRGTRSRPAKRVPGWGFPRGAWERGKVAFRSAKGRPAFAERKPTFPTGLSPSLATLPAAAWRRRLGPSAQFWCSDGGRAARRRPSNLRRQPVL